MHAFSAFPGSIDDVQTAAILTLILIVGFALLRTDRRFAQQHGDLQDVIKSQYEIFKQMNDQGRMIVDCQTQIDRLKREMSLVKHEDGGGTHK